MEKYAISKQTGIYSDTKQLKEFYCLENDIFVLILWNSKNKQTKNCMHGKSKHFSNPGK